jgi:hypothetical protein
MKLLLTAALLSLAVLASAQKEKYISIAVYNTQNAMPFGKLAGMFDEVLHPGIEAGYGKVLSKRSKHEWIGELKLSYFYHRFVQHGIPLYLNFGYRHRIAKRLFTDLSLGAGYMHSIPAAGKYKLNEDGEYENNKGIGRMQATASFGIGLNYLLGPDNERPFRIFSNYQQRVQMPFVRSYVPLLPYNNFILGVSRPVKTKKTSSK